MIDATVFSEGLRILFAHYNRTLQPEVVEIWREFLDLSLSTEQFQLAVKSAILECEFLPTAKKLVEFVKGSLDTIALEEWQTCLAAAASAKSGNDIELSPQGRFALQAIGGCFRLGQADVSRHEWIRKDFVSAWKSYNPALSPALPQSQEHLSTTALPPDFTAKMQGLSQQMSLNRNGKGEQ